MQIDNQYTPLQIGPNIQSDNIYQLGSVVAQW